MTGNKTLTVALFFIIFSAGYSQEPKGERKDHPAFSERIAERERMVREDIMNYPFQPVRDREVLDAMKRVPRHAFVPEEARSA
ncbi:MAG: hypothetical protein EHM46_06090, partial [Bacteroidetes bacterium]